MYYGKLKDEYGIAIYLQAYTAQKMKFSIKDFLSKYDQIRSFLRIGSHLLKKPVMGNCKSILCKIDSK